MNHDEQPDRPAASRTDVLLAVGCGAVALVNYAACLCPTVGPGDSGELTLAALRLGITHPPGYPLFTWLGRIATLVPAAPALAANAMTSLLAAGAVAFLYLAGRAARFSVSGSAVAALCLAFSSTFWNQAESHEVYSLGILLLALLVFLSLKTGEAARAPLLASFVLGLAASHQPTAVFWIPALALFALAGSGRGRFGRMLPSLPLMFLLGLSAGLGTFFRALARPDINWGNPNTIGRFLAHFTGSQYRDLTGSSAGGLLSYRGAALPALLAGELGVPAMFLAALGIFTLLPKNRRLLLGLLLLAATAVFGLSYDVPDFRVHLLPSFVALAVLAGAGATWLESAVARFKPAAGAVAAVLVLAAPGFILFRNFPAARDNRTTIVYDLGSNLLQSLDADAVFVAGSDVSANAARYLQSVRGLRPDVLVVSSEMLFSRPYHEWLGRRIALPDYETMLRAAGTGARTERLQKLLAQVVAATSTARPVFLGTEMMTPGFFSGPVPGTWQVVPRGIVNRLMPRSDSVARDELVSTNHELWGKYRLGSILRDYASVDFQQVQLLYAGSRNNFGMFCLAHGWRDAAVENLKAALALPAPPETRQVFESNLRRRAADARNPGLPRNPRPDSGLPK